MLMLPEAKGCSDAANPLAAVHCPLPTDKQYSVSQVQLGSVSKHAACGMCGSER